MAEPKTKLGHELEVGDVLLKHVDAGSPYAIIGKGGTIQDVGVEGFALTLKIGGKSYELPAMGRYLVKGS